MATEILCPFQYFTDVGGGPLDDGYIYIGVEYQNPLASPKQAYFDSELTIPASGIRTSSGYPVNGNSPAHIYVDGNYSILVKNKNGELVYSELSRPSKDSFIRQLKFDADIIGFTGYDLSDEYLNEKIQIARSHYIGALEQSEVTQTPVTLAAARSTTNPSYPIYHPAIPRHDGDHDISTTQTTQEVIDKFRNEPLTVGGYSSYAVTVSGSTITVSGPSNTIRDALLNCLQNCGLVNRWKSSGEDAAYAGSGADWTYASRIYCVTIAGVDYPITAVSVGSSTITVTGTPASGSQTLYVYPMRIAGSTTSARLRSLAGFVPIPAGDGSLTIMAMAQLMDTMQGHYHNFSGTTGAAGSYIAPTMSAAKALDATISAKNVTTPVTDGISGTPRTSKNTSPRTAGMNAYTWLGVLLATNWTTA